MNDVRADMAVLEFEVGLELDSAEVRGVLLYNGVERGRSVSNKRISIRWIASQPS